MVLTNGEQMFELFTVTSDAYFDYKRPYKSLRDSPRMGVEFFENGVMICAVQYDAGASNNFDYGSKQTYGCMAWNYQTMDSRTELILAASMSALLLLYNPYLTSIEY
jgi:hypothetical protein